MLKRKEKVDFSELANVLMHTNQKVLVVYEEEVTRDHTFSEILDMQKQGAEFYLAEEDWESLPVIGPHLDACDGVAQGIDDAEKEECEAKRIANTITEAFNRANNPSPDPEEEPEEKDAHRLWMSWIVCCSEITRRKAVFRQRKVTDLRMLTSEESGHWQEQDVLPTGSLTICRSHLPRYLSTSRSLSPEN